MVSLLGVVFLALFLALVGMVAWVLWKIRAEKAPRANPTLRQVGAIPQEYAFSEIVWTVVPALATVVLGVLSAPLIFDPHGPPTPPLVVKVTGHQSGWKFDYFEPEGAPRDSLGVPGKLKSLNVSSGGVLTLPQNNDVLFLVTSTDVIHSFSIPELLIHGDVVPGLVTRLWAHTTRVGQFGIQREALCYDESGRMIARLNVVGSQDFRAWLTKKTKPPG